MPKAEPISFTNILMRWLDDKYPDAFRFTNRDVFVTLKKGSPAAPFAAGDLLPVMNRRITYEGVIERKVAVYDGTQSLICAFILSCGVICRSKDGKMSGINIIKQELFDKLDNHFQSWL